MLTTYLVAIFAMAFAGASALTLIYTVNHLDPTDVPPLPSPSHYTHAEETMGV